MFWHICFNLEMLFPRDRFCPGGRRRVMTVMELKLIPNFLSYFFLNLIGSGKSQVNVCEGVFNIAGSAGTDVMTEISWNSSKWGSFLRPFSVGRRIIPRLWVGGQEVQQTARKPRSVTRHLSPPEFEGDATLPVWLFLSPPLLSEAVNVRGVSLSPTRTTPQQRQH